MISFLAQQKVKEVHKCCFYMGLRLFCKAKNKIHIMTSKQVSAKQVLNNINELVAHPYTYFIKLQTDKVGMNVLYVISYFSQG